MVEDWIEQIEDGYAEEFDFHIIHRRSKQSGASCGSEEIDIEGINLTITYMRYPKAAKAKATLNTDMILCEKCWKSLVEKSYKFGQYKVITEYE